LSDVAAAGEPASYDEPLPGPAPELARRAGSVRRTSHLDVTRGEGGFGFGPFLAMGGAARDLLTEPDPRPTTAGRAEPRPGVVVGEAEVTLTFDESGAISAVVATPTPRPLEVLIGGQIGFGFRARIKEVLRELDGTPLGLLLDDLSGAPAPSGYGAVRERMLLGSGELLPPGGAMPPGANTQRNVCAGWREGGAPDRSRVEGTAMPFEAEPPVAPLLGVVDAQGWHAMAPLGARQSRRLRRLDVWRRDGAVLVNAMFRDSTTDPDLTPRVVHEYAVTATLDPDDLVIDELVAEPRSLPFPTDCPWAAGSAQLLVGQPVAALRTEVRHLSFGAVSCTHLNDVFRSFSDIPTLLGYLPV
jgi:hypothetical protein